MQSILIVSVLALFLYLACTTAPESQSPVAIHEELEKLDHMLRDSAFAIGMAQAQDAAYYHEQGKRVPPFLPGEDSSQVISRKVRDERIAESLSPFYALECGVGAIMRKKRGTTPVTILRQVSGGNIDSTSRLLLLCFANATWKAGQPFLGLNRIQDSNFRSVDLLTAADRRRYEERLRLVANKLIVDMEDVAAGTCQMQSGRLKSLMQDAGYTIQMAGHIDATSLKTEAANIERNKFEEKIATNLPALYALEGGIAFLARTQRQLPSVLIRSINDGTMDKEDMMLMARFANATWKASQPFIGLNRITGSTFIPFNQLSDEEVEKDRVQIRAAAAFVSQNVFSGTQKRY